jgi:hypothetical protein
MSSSTGDSNPRSPRLRWSSVQLAARAATDAAIAKLGTPVVASTSSTSDFQHASGVHGRRPRARNRLRRLQAFGRRPSSPSPLFSISVGTIGFVGKCQNSGREWDSLVIAKISLIAQSNSLQGGNKFPVRMRRELARKGSDLMPIFGRGWRVAKRFSARQLGGAGSPPGHYEGVLGGARYLINVPPDWNGGLIMFAHGYEGEGSGKGAVHSEPLADQFGSTMAKARSFGRKSTTAVVTARTPTASISIDTAGHRKAKRTRRSRQASTVECRG